MKKFLWLLLFVAIFTLAGIANGQEGTVCPSTEAPEEETPSIDQVFCLASARAMIESMKAGDFDFFSQYLAEEVTWSTPEGLPWSGTWIGKEAVLGGLAWIQGTNLQIDDILTYFTAGGGKVFICWHLVPEGETRAVIHGVTFCRFSTEKMIVYGRDYLG
jgi:hypothetical protein